MKIHSMSVSIPQAEGHPLCNAHCPFCISRLTGKATTWSTGRIHWQKKLERAFKFSAKNGVNTLLITGKGEPFCNLNDVLATLRIAVDYFSIIEIQTNGSLCTEETLSLLTDSGLTTLAISISHPIPHENSNLIGIKDGIDYKKSAEIAKKLGLVVRASFNVSRVWYHDNESPLSYVKKIVSPENNPLLDQITFRKLGIPPVSQLPEISKIRDWILENSLPDSEFDEITDFIKKNGIFIRSLNWGASIYDVNGYSVAVVDCLQKPGYTEEDVRSVIFMPDGHVYTSWETKGSILF